MLDDEKELRPLNLFDILIIYIHPSKQYQTVHHIILAIQTS